MTRRRKVQRGRIASQSRSRGTTRSRNTTPNLQLYVEDAATDMQPRLTDFIPRRHYGLFVWLFCGLILVALVQALYVCWDTQFNQLIRSHTQFLTLNGPGSLATWISSMLLALGASVALTVFSLRRHKLDDYRGAYGLWLYVAGACGLASLDVATGLHRTFQAGMVHFTNKTLWGDGSVWWIGAVSAVALILCLRVIIDSWRSRGAVIFMLLAVTSYTFATIFHLKILQVHPADVDLMITVSLTMLGHVLLAYSMLVYARYVFREATGELKKKKKKARSGKTARTGGHWLFGKKPKPKTAKKKAAVEVDEEAETDEEETEAGEEEYEYEYEEVDDLAELERLTDPNASESKSDQRKSRKKQRRQNRRAA